MNVCFKNFFIVKILALIAFLLTCERVAAEHLSQEIITHSVTDDFQVGKSFQSSSDKLFISDIKVPDKLGITFDENPPYFYSDTIQVIVNNWYPGWQNDVEWCLYEKGSDIVIGDLARHGFFEDGLHTSATFCGYFCRKDKKPLFTGNYELQILDKASGEPLSGRYPVVYEAPKLDIMEVTTNDFTTNNYWLFRIKVKNNNPYRLAAHNSLVSADGDLIFDSDLYCLDTFLGYYTMLFEPGDEVIFEYNRPCFSDNKEPTPGLNGFIFKTILTNTFGVSGSVDGETGSPEDFGFKPIVVDEYSFSVPVYNIEDAKEYFITPEVKFEDVTTSVDGETLDITFDIKVVKGAMASEWGKEVEEGHINSTALFWFSLAENNSEMSPSTTLSLLDLSGKYDENGIPLDKDFILFEGESRHFRFRVDPVFGKNFVKTNVPYILGLKYYKPYNLANKEIPQSFIATYEYTLNSSNIEDVINADISLPIEIYSLSGIKLKDDILSLSSGEYIIKQGEIVKKVVIK